MDNDLDKFFDKRSIGYGNFADVWFWRGQGYDEGWEDVTDDELRSLHSLLGAYLEKKKDNNE